MRVWIETLILTSAFFSAMVTLYVRVWIETQTEVYQLFAHAWSPST